MLVSRMALGVAMALSLGGTALAQIAAEPETAKTGAVPGEFVLAAETPAKAPYSYAKIVAPVTENAKASIAVKSETVADTEESARAATIPAKTVSETKETPDAKADATPTSYQSYISHYVETGDTLYNISKRYNVSLKDLKAANGLSENAISIGQSLAIPAVKAAPAKTEKIKTPAESDTVKAIPAESLDKSARVVKSVQPIPGDVYAVLPGDTLYSISKRACVKVDDMVGANENLDAAALQPGQRLALPSNHCLK